MFTGFSTHLLPRNVTSCIMSQPSSASNAHFAEDSPLCVNVLSSKSMFFIALAAYPTQRHLSKTQFLTTQLRGMKNLVTQSPALLAASTLGSAIDTRRNAAPCGIGTTRYW